MARRANLSVYRDRENKEGHQVCAILLSGRDMRKSDDPDEAPEEFELDPREGPEDKKDEPTEDVVLDDNEPTRVVKIGTNLQEAIKTSITRLLREYKDIFAWSHKDMLGIDTKVISHYLAVSPESRPVIQKRRLFNPDRSAAIKKEVEKLLAAGSIREV